MNSLILIVLAIGAGLGFYQGAFKQIANFLGIAAGFALAAMLYKPVGDALATHSGTSATVGHTVGFVVIAIIVPVVLGVLASVLTKAFSALHLGFVNRFCGAALGALSYGLVLSSAFNVMDLVTSNFGFSPEKLEPREELYYMVKHAAQPVIPDMAIVTDSTEVAKGIDPRYGLRSSLSKLLTP